MPENEFMEPKLLTRTEFREGTFARDNHKCVICGEPSKDAHHIIERRLFTDGGYYLDNGSSLCENHHIMAEETTLSCDEIRKACGIENIILPDHFYSDLAYDKWGNIELPNGNRLKGELFYDESVQKILKQGGVLDLFQKYVKYSRTHHLPGSQMGKDDRMMPDDSFFHGKRVIATIKMDGENTTMYNDYIHARSINSDNHPTRNWVKGLWSRIGYLLGEDLRLCGENLYAKHSIKYNDLSSYFMAFSIWQNNTCLSWDESLDFFQILEVEHVPVFYDGIYDAKKIREEFEKVGSEHEGYVIRVADEFNYADFRKCVGKYVKPEFRQRVNNAHGHWISSKIETNELAK